VCDDSPFQPFLEYVAPNADAEALFAAHQTGLLRYLRRAVGHAETARDLTQDVFVRMAGAGALPPTDNERKAWIFRIAKNLAIDHRRRHEVRLADSATGRPDAARPADQDTSLAVNEALAAIDALDRDVFLLREAGGLSYAEIAAACDLTVSAVRSRIHRARLDLRERLSDPIAAVLAKNKG
jgi:RNA polymerase sigma-70 factor (ECF subfamily)